MRSRDSDPTSAALFPFRSGALYIGVRHPDEKDKKKKKKKKNKNKSFVEYPRDLATDERLDPNQPLPENPQWVPFLLHNVNDPEDRRRELEENWLVWMRLWWWTAPAEEDDGKDGAQKDTESRYVRSDGSDIPPPIARQALIRINIAQSEARNRLAARRLRQARERLNQDPDPTERATLQAHAERYEAVTQGSQQIIDAMQPFADALRDLARAAASAFGSSDHHQHALDATEAAASLQNGDDERERQRAQYAGQTNLQKI